MAPARRRKIRVAAFEIIIFLAALALFAGGLWLMAGRDSSESRIAVMEQRLRNMRRLKTASRTYRSVIYVEEKNFWRGSKQVLFTIEYEVSAGVDFSRGVAITPLSDGIVSVRLPPAEIFSADADEGSIHEMFVREQSLFNPVSMGDYMPQVIAQGEANRKAAEEGGILEHAEANARKAVVRVLRLGDVEEVVFGPPLAAGGPAVPEPSAGNAANSAGEADDG